MKFFMKHQHQHGGYVHADQYRQQQQQRAAHQHLHRDRQRGRLGLSRGARVQRADGPRERAQRKHDGPHGVDGGRGRTGWHDEQSDAGEADQDADDLDELRALPLPELTEHEPEGDGGHQHRRESGGHPLTGPGDRPVAHEQEQRANHRRRLPLTFRRFFSATKGAPCVQQRAS